MKVYYDAKLLAVVPKEFTNDEGEQVTYKEAYFLNETEEGVREVIKMNTKLTDIEKAENEEGMIEVDIDVTGKNKPRLLGFKPKVAQ